MFDLQHKKPATSSDGEHTQILPHTDGEQLEQLATHGQISPTETARDTESSDKDSLQNAMEKTKIAELRLKRELNETKAKLEGADGRIRQLQDQLVNSQRQAGQLHSQHTASVQEVKKQKYEVGKLTALYNSMTNQLQTLDKERFDAISERDSWRLEAEGFREEMSRCKDALFSLQPQEQIPDSQISREWEALCDQISRWVDDEISTEATLKALLRKADEARQFTGIVAEFWNDDVQRLAARYPGSLDDLFQFQIHRLLEDRLFKDSIYLVTLNSNQAKLLRSLEVSLSNLKPERGKTHPWNDIWLLANLQQIQKVSMYTNICRCRVGEPEYCCDRTDQAFPRYRHVEV